MGVGGIERGSSGMKVASLFAGAGGLDLGIQKVGFDVVQANEFDPKVQETFQLNFPDTVLDKRSIVDIPAIDVPVVDGMI